MILVDTNVIAETMRPRPDPHVVAWLVTHDSDLALPAVVVGELAYGIEKIRHDERSPRLLANLSSWRQRFSGRILTYDEDAALIYGRIMGTAKLQGRVAEAPDGMIAAIALKHGAAVATRNVDHFQFEGVKVIDPWAG